MKVAIIHYDEIALKGKNRSFFENKLKEAIIQKCRCLNLMFDVKITYRDMILFMPESQGEWNDDLDETVEKILKTTPGVATFGIGLESDLDKENPLDSLKKSQENVVKLLAKKTDFETFKVLTKRPNKQFPMKSPDISRAFGGAILKNSKRKLGVKMKDADIEVIIEVTTQKFFVYIKQKGIGGLAIGSSGNAVVLISGGIDSPVAAYLMARRGITPLFLHFHAYPQTSQQAVDKVRDLMVPLSKYIPKIHLAMVPLLNIQNEIMLKCPERLRIILARRFMFRIAERWAKKNKALALITGESVGQVASQTLENMLVVERATLLPVLRPLCGSHKVEIINIAKSIGTFDISIQPHEDCCTVHMPKQAETKARLMDVEIAEKELDIDGLIEKTMAEIEAEEIVLKEI